MIVFPHAKINLGLNVVRKRPDGFHDIESVLVPIPLHDILEVVIDRHLAENEVVFGRTGLPVPGDPEQDLCMKAVRAVQAHRMLPGLRMHLHKVIPMGAGLGGGSSDGAHVLQLLNDLLGLKMTRSDLHELAGGLGSDCAFFLNEGAQLVQGRGDEMRPVPLDQRGYWILLVNPGEHVSTAEVYRNTTPSGSSENLEALLMEHQMEDWQSLVRNRMETFVVSTHPSVGIIKQRLLQAGASYAAMSGSGSTVFGLFQEEPPVMEWPSKHRAWSLRLQN
jgi:4-diphosphocytidyl-2-C-methyl-D-erythritol kinase